jgi:hypothetical protein
MNMNMDEVAAPFSGSKYGRAEEMEEIEELEDTRPGVGALKVREEDLMGERAATGPTNREYRASDFSVRTAMVRDVLKDQLKEAETVSFQSISKGVSRRTAAACFLEVHSTLFLCVLVCIKLINEPFVAQELSIPYQLMRASKVPFFTSYSS